MRERASGANFSETAVGAATPRVQMSIAIRTKADRCCDLRCIYTSTTVRASSPNTRSWTASGSPWNRPTVSPPRRVHHRRRQRHQHRGAVRVTSPAAQPARRRLPSWDRRRTGRTAAPPTAWQLVSPQRHHRTLSAALPTKGHRHRISNSSRPAIVDEHHPTIRSQRRGNGRPVVTRRFALHTQGETWILDPPEGV